MQLDELFNYKNQLIGDIVSNPTIVNLLSDDGSPNKKAEELIYTQVFPYEYIPDTVQHGYTFICCEVDVTKNVSNTYWGLTMYIWIFTHKSKMKAPGGGVRVDKIASEISKTINGSFNYGLGKLDLYNTRRFAPAPDYQGKMLTFHADDFIHDKRENHKRPINRKRGS